MLMRMLYLVGCGEVRVAGNKVIQMLMRTMISGRNEDNVDNHRMMDHYLLR